jgi:hypothetical protein
MKEGKRRSLFGLAGLQIGNKDDEEPAHLLRKKRAASFMTNISTASTLREDSESLDGSAAKDGAAFPLSASLSRGSRERSTSVLGSMRGHRLLEDPDEPPSATSVRSLSSNWTLGDDIPRNRLVLRHGEVQTSGSVFRRKKEYLVLTERHLIRFKSQQKAAEAFAM